MEPKPRIHKAKDNPLAAALLGATLLKAGQQEKDQSKIDTAVDLIKGAEKAPRLPDSPMDKAIKQAVKELEKSKLS